MKKIKDKLNCAIELKALEILKDFEYSEDFGITKEEFEQLKNNTINLYNNVLNNNERLD